ncbi:hypothetical protein EAE96_011040 [Botrytis aclada]|nr:hypothetical protein EAE96_011040 [Botrytis aclada]
MAPAPPPQTSASSVPTPSITTLLPITVAKALETGSASKIPSIEILPPKSTSAPKSTPTLSTSIISKTSSTIFGSGTASATSTADNGVFTRPSGSLTAIITMIIVAVFMAYCVIRCCVCKSMRKRKERKERKELERERGDLERERVRQMREREAIEMAGRMRKDGWEDVLLHGRHVG